MEEGTNTEDLQEIELDCGESITYSCKPNYETNDVTTLTCQNDGTMSHSPPICTGNLFEILYWWPSYA